MSYTEKVLAELKQRYPEAYSILLNACYPYLRHSDYEVKYKIRPMSDREAAALISTEPRLLSLTKMYRIAALYEPGSDQYNEVIETAANVYPADTEANLNAASVALRQADITRAGSYLKRAGQTPAAINARGVLALLQGHLAQAQQLFEQAAANGSDEAKRNLALITAAN